MNKFHVYQIRIVMTQGVKILQKLREDPCWGRVWYCAASAKPDE